MAKNPFNQVQMNRPGKNQFDLSHEKLLTTDMGVLVPNLVQEVIPGDTFTVNTETLVRFAPMLAPIMHRIDVHQHYFFVPNRLLWDEWRDFITGGEDGTDLPSFPRLQMSSQNLPYLSKGDLSDYLGIPPQTTANGAVEFSALPFRAYQLIYDEYYRDQNLQDSLDIDTGSGLVLDSDECSKLLALRRRAWEKDYFTSALPWTQRGNEVELPLGSLNVEYKTQSDVISPGTSNLGTTHTLAHTDNATSGLKNNDGDALRIENIDEINSTVDSVTINELRRATRLQRWLEIAARAGSRYIEQIQAHFGVRTSDYRLQRPEFLGGGKTPVMISEVLTNAHSQDASSNDIPVGEMYGHAISVGEQSGFKKFFEEHGYIIGIMSIMPRANYHQGLHKHWTKFDKFDYFWPEFAHLGEQEIKKKELYLSGATGLNEETFGYQQRYAEYKYAFGGIHGDFRDNMDHYHLSRIFGSHPVLNTGFVQCEPDTRIFAVESGVQHCWVQLYHKISAVRPIPYFSIPEL